MPPSSPNFFDRSRLRLLPLGDRIHDLDGSCVRPLPTQPCAPPEGRLAPLGEVASRVRAAREAGAEVVLMIGGHVVRSGTQRFLIDLLERGLVTCLAMNGACVIHDYEFALIGATTESVARYVREGQFGLWRETGGINEIINAAYRSGETVGMGAAVGRAIEGGEFPHKDISLLAACHRLGVPATVHVSIGQDIIHEHPNCDGAATGELSYRDFLTLARVLGGIEGGVVMDFGSAVMAPEVYLKALSMARNAANAEGGGRSLGNITTLVCDLHDLPSDVSQEAPKDSAAYYFRPWKTMLVRTVADGGRGVYVRGRHDETVPALWCALTGGEGGENP